MITGSFHQGDGTHIALNIMPARGIGRASLKNGMMGIFLQSESVSQMGRSIKQKSNFCLRGVRKYNTANTESVVMMKLNDCASI